MAKPVFKPCMQNQLMLLPPDISELIPENSKARLVDRIVEGLDRGLLISLYPGGGASAYDPSMMLKVVLLAYSSGIYSSRKIEQATRENINFMWICGMKPLEHSTINRFRTERIRPVFEEIFTQVVRVLAEAGHITLDTYFLDGTKLEANANKYTFVWKKNVDRYQQALQKKVHALLDAIDEMEAEEEKLAPAEPSEVDSEKIQEALGKINERLKGKKERGEKAPELKKAAHAIEKDHLDRMKTYEGYQEAFAGRNNLSKTDPDATFMRLKDDHMQNGQLKAAYNIQCGTENQFIVSSTVHQRPGDTACAIPHLEHVKKAFGHIPENMVADAGYGSEENYTYLESEGVTAYVKHNEFFRECKKKYREDEMRVANWAYDETADTYTCPEGRTLAFKKEQKKASDLGFVSTTRLYACADCSECSRRDRCIKSDNPDHNRTIQVNPKLDAHKRKASALLHTEEGSALRKKRGIDVETVFGDIKRNLGFNRFTLRGLEKVAHEWLLVAAGHNIRKLFLAEIKKTVAAVEDKTEPVGAPA